MKFLKVFKTKIFLAVFSLLLIVSNVLTLTSENTFNSATSLISAIFPVNTVSEKFEIERQSLQTKISKLQEQNSSLFVENNRLKKRNKLHEAKIVEYKEKWSVFYDGNRISIQNAVASATKKISQKIAGSVAKNAGSAVAEAVPFYGIAVVAAVTAWEVRDSCSVMKELYELNVAFNPSARILEESTQVCGTRVPKGDELWAIVKSSPEAALGKSRKVWEDMPEIEISQTYQRVLGWGAKLLSLGSDKDEKE